MIATDDSWRAFHGVHGGLVLAWLLDEAHDAAGHQAGAVTAHFLRSVDPGPADLETDVLHDGRSTGSVAVRLSQAGRLRAHAVVSLGQPDEAAGWSPVLDLTGLPDPAGLPSFSPPVELVPFGQHVDIRPVGGALPGAGAEEPRYDAWIGLRDPGVAVALGPRGTAAVLLDAMPPGLLATWTTPRAVPTVEITAHFAPAVVEPADWWHIRHVTRWAGGTTCVDEAELHLPDGRLVAQARQLRRIL